MATYNNNYDKLYENMKNRLTVVNEDSEYTLGEYMSMKADLKKTEAMLPVAERSSAGKGERAVAMLISYVNDKLTVKEPPVKDKTIRAFPFRASASAFLSAVVACTFMLSFAVIGAKIIAPSIPVAEASVAEAEDADMEDTENVLEKNN